MIPLYYYFFFAFATAKGESGEWKECAAAAGRERKKKGDSPFMRSTLHGFCMENGTELYLMMLIAVIRGDAAGELADVVADLLRLFVPLRTRAGWVLAFAVVAC